MKSAAIRPKTMCATLAAETDSVQEIIRRMDWAALEIILVVDKQGTLKGTITDGDIRRGILNGVELSQPATAVMNSRPLAVPEGTSRSDTLQIMRRFSIRHLPVLDEERHPVRLELLENLVDEMRGQSAVIMAGGLGTRLHPLTEHTPKPLLKVADQPILDHILASLREGGIEDVVISLNYLGDHIRRHVGNGDGYQMNVDYVNETKRLGTAGALSLLNPRPQRPFLVMNGDLLTNMNFTSLFRYQKKTRHDIVMCVRKYKMTIPYGVVDLKHDTVVGLREKPSHEYFINAGIYIISPRCLDLIPADTYFDMPDLIQKVMKEGGTAGAFPIIEYWRDIGNHEDYNAATKEKLNAEAALQMGREGQGIPAEVIE